MRAVTVVGALLAGAASTLSAQHAHQLEIGGFGTYTRYDKAFQLDNQFGGGGRVGFFLGNALGLELDGTLAYPNRTAVAGHTQMRWASASLVLNYHTAYFALSTRGRLAAGETVLVHGAAGGVGTATLQDDRYR